MGLISSSLYVILYCPGIIWALNSNLADINILALFSVVNVLMVYISPSLNGLNRGVHQKKKQRKKIYSYNGYSIIKINIWYLSLAKKKKKKGNVMPIPWKLNDFI